MAQAPGHRFGQIIGEMLELAMRPPLIDVARKHGLYLDWKHDRAARDGLKLVKWKDSKGNDHDLDYVLEAGGSEDTQGAPKAFIETAYRRYTKHSRNKAQEIQGAITPLAETYSDYQPFLGVVLAGVFTSGSLAQLRSHNFGVLYFPFDSIVRAFEAVNIDAFFDEDTPDDNIQAKVDAYDALSEADRKRIGAKLRTMHKRDVAKFIQDLELCLTRSIERVFILTLHGGRCEAKSVDEAIKFIEDYEEDCEVNEFVRYEVNVRYNNGDEIAGRFEAKSDAVKFLRSIS
jgi:hypothetical protein